LPAAKVGNSESVQVGDQVIAIGSPFGLEASVTSGIISALGRDIGAEQFQRFIQTDAAINPGNSGGPLVNMTGEIIGINTMIATQSGGYQGIGFALPVNLAARVYNSIIQYGRMTRGSIGISFNKNEKEEVLKSAGLKNGVVVTDVTKGGPAEKAGVKQEDIITAINGKPVKDGDDLVARVAETPVGSEMTLSLDRGGKKIETRVTIQDREEVFKDDPRFARHRSDVPEPVQAEGTPAKFGISIRNMSDPEKKELSLDDPRGVLITRVEEGSFAEEIGLNEKDVIVSINRQPVASADDVRRIQGTLKPGDPVAFRVMRALPAAVRSGRAQWQSFFAAGTLPANQ
jgi:serine protease Do